MNQRFNSGLESEVLDVHVCNSILGMVLVWIRNALRRSGGGRDGVLHGRNKECCSWFSRFTADLLESASSGSANAVAVLGFYKSFARNGALSNGDSGNPS